MVLARSGRYENDVSSHDGAFGIHQPGEFSASDPAVDRSIPKPVSARSLVTYRDPAEAGSNQSNAIETKLRVAAVKPERSAEKLGRGNGEPCSRAASRDSDHLAFG